MREMIEFRVPECYAAKHLPDEAGTKLGIVRKLELCPEDPLFAQIGQRDREYQADGRAFFTAWIPHRKYSSRELAQAEMLKVSPKTVFEPAGEECGTRYDDAQACPICGGGAPQITPLFLNGRRLPRGMDYAETIAGEVVISRRFADLFRAECLSGATFEPVRLINEHGAPSKEHYQLSVTGARVHLDDMTRVGNDPFDNDNGGRCQRGDLVGLNLLSEVRVRRSTYKGDDVAETNELIGIRRGLLRPRPVLLFSARAWKAIDAAKLKGFVIEAAHLV
jgi:hypothetical protein